MSRGRKRAFWACLGLGLADLLALDGVLLPGVLGGRAPILMIAPAAAAARPVAAARAEAPRLAVAPAPVLPIEAEVEAEVEAGAAAGEPVATIEFEPESARVGRRATFALERLVARHGRSAGFMIVGHASVTGTTELDEQLSARRAHATARRLARLGVARERLEVVARGAAEPRGPGQNDRRVTIFPRSGR